MKRYTIPFAILTILTVALTASAQSAAIHKVDFKNFTYSAYCAGEKPENINVKNGEFSREKQEDGYVDRFYFTVFDVAFGDLTGDGQDETVVLSSCNTGGSGNFSEGYIYGLQNGRPILLARIPGGDRGYGGLRSANVSGGLLVVESNDPGETGAACCPEFILTTKYKLAGKRIAQVGSPAKREAIPTIRVRFSRGSSSATMRTDIPAGESVRFIVGARAGQKLAAATTPATTEIRLVDDPDTPSSLGTFSTTLTRSGDFTIEVTNTSSADIRAATTISIK